MIVIQKRIVWLLSGAATGLIVLQALCVFALLVWTAELVRLPSSSPIEPWLLWMVTGVVVILPCASIILHVAVVGWLRNGRFKGPLVVLIAVGSIMCPYLSLLPLLGIGGIPRTLILLCAGLEMIVLVLASVVLIVNAGHKTGKRAFPVSL